ncbi:T9SS type B sorting domain-containing protein [Taibaiella soli]|uniref:PKD domain-containing protein n=1 Tax=Taibaiella soli TaxID=1649169 RepID=A0A2W2B442_9BACT|nr:gliding motility-associated C-terminal domain-containing protein [Taibaiella soli]PZF70897.1 hypothetical protein DN068_20950 [Taibaiella soli]
MARSIPVRIKSVLLFLFAAVISFKGIAQCNNWSISAQAVTPSTCSSSGTFSVTLSGADVANLTNVQYGIPLTNGFSVALNNSPNFSSIPPGTYPVNVVADCGGVQITKSTTVVVPGNYQLPVWGVLSARASFDCMSTGKLYLSVQKGLPPYTFHLTAWPASYSGPTTHTTSASNDTFSNLPAGNYTYECTDACGSGITPNTYTVPAFTPSTLPFQILPPYLGSSCNPITISFPVQTTDFGVWTGYMHDTSVKVSVSISNNVFSPTPYKAVNISGGIQMTMNPGFSLKNCAGATLIYTFHPPCGSDWQKSIPITGPSLQFNPVQNCATFNEEVLCNLLCTPITYTYSNAAGTVFGPYTANNNDFTLSGLPNGNYSITCTSADGATVTSNFSSTSISSNPYSVSIVNGSAGLNNYIDYFRFNTTVNTQGRHIELVSGPPGYSYSASWTNFPDDRAVNNQTPVFPGTLLFQAGNYVWKITDSCGSYLLPITVGPPDLYQYTAGIDHQKQTCAGLWIWPNGTATNNGVAKPVGFYIYFNGLPFNWTGTWPDYHPGDSLLLTVPGTYTIVPFSITKSNYNSSVFPGPNVYVNSYTFIYTLKPVQVDMDRTQGVICNPTATGQAEIYAQGKDGLPFVGYSGHYQYYLALAGNGTTGPYIANNTTGIFSNFGGNANDLFDIKIVDSCGASALQQIKILDLSTTRIATANQFVSCPAGTVQLNAIYLPGATYSWTGPNGFTSNLQQPVISNLSALNAGVYYVTVTVPFCTQPAKDSTTLVLNPLPPVPTFTINCGPPVVLNISNPSPSYKYNWVLHTNFSSPVVTLPSTNGNSLTVPSTIGSYWPVAVDTISGCSTMGLDSFNYTPIGTVQIYAPKSQICAGDSSTLVATSGFVSYQWYKNNTAIPGATTQTFAAAAAGTYKVAGFTSLCQSILSGNVILTVLATPFGTIEGATHDICTNSSVLLQADTGTGYTYIWKNNNVVIPGATQSSYTASASGSYTVTVSNGICNATSTPFALTVHAAPTVNITPSTTQTICTGGVVNFSTPFCSSCTYTWLQNSIAIPGASSNIYTANSNGTYSVMVGNGGICPDVTSTPVTVAIVPPPTATITGATHDICANTSVLLQTDTNAAYTYSWKKNNVTIPGATVSNYNATTSGNYTVVASNGICTVTSAPFVLTVHPLPVASISPSAIQNICPGETIILATPSDPAFSYVWQHDGNTIPGNNANTYTASDTGSYNVIVSSAFCPSDTSLAVTINRLPSTVHLPNDTVICSQNPFAITLDAGPGFTNYSWSTGATSEQITATKAGVYWVTVTNHCGSFTDSIIIHSLSEYLPNLPADTIVCNQNNSATLTVGSLYNSIHWSTGATSPSITVAQAGTYWVKVETPCGTIYDTTKVAFCAPVVDAMNLPQQTICEGDCIEPTAQVSNFPLTYQWYFPGGNPATANAAVPGIICYANAGTYPIKLVVSNASGSDSMTMQIKVNSKPVSEFKDSSITVPYNTSLSLPACAAAQTVDWYQDGKLICANCPTLKIGEAKSYNATYHCVVSNGDCHDSCTYSIRVIDIPHNIWLPDAFTPNGDGRNDVFHIITDNPNVLVNSLSVFNRWGQRVFVSNLNNDGWDGTFNGKACELGTYYWMIEYKILGTKEVYFLKGDVELIR